MGMMINRRRACGGKKGLLPSGYRQLEYIENTSNAYINTGVYGSATIDFDIKFQLIGSQPGYWPTILGHNINNAAECYCLQLDTYPHSHNFDYQFKFGTHMYKLSNEDYYLHTIKKINNAIFFDSNTGINLDNSSVSTTKKPLGILARYSSNDEIAAFGVGKVYYCKLYNNDVLIRNFIPCINPQNVVGMYDLVEGKFYSSPNGTAFVAGPEV